jgi:hypothetical protein
VLCLCDRGEGGGADQGSCNSEENTFHEVLLLFGVKSL